MADDTGSKGGPAPSKLRIDKWLWYARIVKSRSLAQQLVKSGKVRVNSTRISSASSPIGTGDVLTITLPRQIKVLKIVTSGSRRGPAPEAQKLYQDLSPPPVKKERAMQPLKQAVRDEGTGRPTKKQRRELTRFRSGAGEEF